MKIKIIISLVILISAVFVYDAFTNFGSTNQSGAPAGFTGSPGDGFSCNNSNCHSGNPVTNDTGWITTNIPGTGYVNGATYQITATCTHTGTVKFGFEVSPQNAAGVQRGTLIVSDATHTQLSGSSKYITHTLTGTSGMTNSHTWTFNWKAPTAGPGPVTFYGAFNCTNNNGNSFGDLIFLSNTTVQQNTSGINDVPSGLFDLVVYPNPSNGNISVNFNLEKHSDVTVTIYDIYGKALDVLLSQSLNNGTYTYKFDLNKYAKGMYLLLVSDDSGTLTKKLVIQ